MYRPVSVFLTFLVLFCLALPTPGSTFVVGWTQQGYQDLATDGTGYRQVVVSCGNGSVDASEQCDDGNFVAGDGCDPECMVEAVDASGGGRFDGAFSDGSFDLFSLSLTGASRVAIETSDGLGGCPADTAIAIFSVSPNGDRDTLERDDDSGVGPCSALEVSLVSGSYEVIVSGFGGRAVEAYVVDIVVGLVTCGDGDIGPGEECDDGNSADLDGCDAECNVESVDIGDGGRFVGGFKAGSFGLFAFTLSSPARLDARLDSSPVPCSYTEDLTLFAVGSDGQRNRIGYSDRDDDRCALMRRSLPEGTYEVVVQSRDRALPYYTLDVTFEDPFCGDGIVDALEECDDSGLTDGDGCDSFCRAEPIDISGGGQFSASIGPGALNRFTFLLSDVRRFSAEINDGIDGCPIPYDTETMLFFTESDGSVSFVAGGTTNALGCSTVVRQLDAGRYELIVSGRDGGAGGSYVLEASMPVPTCGDGTRDPVGVGSGGTGTDDSNPLIGVGSSAASVSLAESEECDDGNTDAGDGCSPVCEVESLDISGGGRFEGGRTSGSFDRYSFTVASLQRIEALVSDGIEGCPDPYDIEMRLYEFTDSGFWVRSGDINAGGCPVLVMTIEQGEYELVIDSRFYDTLPAYVLDVSFSDPQCGDGIVDVGLDIAEECDDGNLSSGDGCDDACIVEATDVTGGGSFDGRFEPRSFDLFTFTLEESLRVSAEVQDGSGGCPFPFDGEMTLYEAESGRPDKYVASGTRNDLGCALLVEALEAGEYVIEVRSYDIEDLGPYVFEVVFEPFACGDGVVDLAAEETCDDGGVAGGDGCDAACDVEPIDITEGGIFESGTAPRVFDIFTLSVDENTRVLAEMTNDVGGCGVPYHHDMILFDVTTGVEVTYVDRGDFNEIGCRTIVRALSPGEYELVVSTYSVASSDTYLLDVEFENPGCGDARVDVGIGEECDDGNLAVDDGCDASCLVEPIEIGDGGRFEGGFEDGESDVYGFTTSTEVRVVLETSDGEGDCSYDTIMTLYLVNETGERVEVAYDDDSGPGYCSFLSHVVAPGTYEFVVAGYNGQAVPFYVVDATFVAPMCGDHFADGSQGEECDGYDDDACPGRCQVTCLCAPTECGNGIVEQGERCDDGNLDNGDVCSMTCGELCGDYDGDGIVEASDALGVLRAAVGLADCNEVDIAVCDPSGDGETTSADALLVLRVAVGTPVPLICPALL